MFFLLPNLLFAFTSGYSLCPVGTTALLLMVWNQWCGITDRKMVYVEKRGSDLTSLVLLGQYCRHRLKEFSRVLEMLPGIAGELFCMQSTGCTPEPQPFPVFRYAMTAVFAKCSWLHTLASLHRSNIYVALIYDNTCNNNEKQIISIGSY